MGDPIFKNSFTIPVDVGFNVIDRSSHALIVVEISSTLEFIPLTCNSSQYKEMKESADILFT